MNMTENDAKKEIEHNAFCNTDDFEMKISKECYKTIINALERQIAKKVIVSPYNNMKYCPICEVSVTGMYFDYCVECGQKLDWSEVE